MYLSTMWYWLKICMVLGTRMSSTRQKFLVCAWWLFKRRLILMLGEKLAELVSFIGEDKAKALSVHSAIESDFHVCHLKRKCLGFYMQSQCAYLTGGLPLAVGDFVVVPVGNRNAEKTGCVTDVFVCSAQDAPYPPEKAKFVLRKSERSAAPEKSETWSKQRTPADIIMLSVLLYEIVKQRGAAWKTGYTALFILSFKKRQSAFRHIEKSPIL